MIEELIGQVVVVDLKSTYVCLGTLQRVDEQYLDLKNADLHDMRDSDSTRENYVAAAARSGVTANRKRVLLVRSDVIAIARLVDFVAN
jgi:hypothetical protein